MTRLDGDVRVAVAPVAVDVERLAAGVDQLDAFDRPVEQLSRIRQSELRGELGLIAAETEDRLSATAARGTPADGVAFQQNDLAPGLGEIDGGGEPRQAATENRHIAVQTALQGWVSRRGMGGGLIPGLAHGRRSLWGYSWQIRSGISDKCALRPSFRT